MLEEDEIKLDHVQSLLWWNKNSKMRYSEEQWWSWASDQKWLTNFNETAICNFWCQTCYHMLWIVTRKVSLDLSIQ